ncbi:hypothetical protein RvY_01365 [Ramazzottius varieornatus]|uniref:Uncharacterized protein n=1 Tax=Ramazzottius varieornatus TaxID=947166 RepID=A0A1D1UK10_RAMVA|nr:hypothetical protein RvY_01365 [Ramazzottius varieornatus]
MGVAGRLRGDDGHVWLYERPLHGELHREKQVLVRSKDFADNEQDRAWDSTMVPNTPDAGRPISGGTSDAVA